MVNIPPLDETIEEPTTLTSVVSRGCPNAANTSKHSPRSEYFASIIEIWKQFITTEIVNLILHYTNLKINAFLDTLDQERKPYHVCTLEAKKLLEFFGLFYARDYFIIT